MSATKKQRPRFRVGDRVSILYGPWIVVAQVLEDRGRLGVRGERLYRIGVDLGGSEPTALEVPEEDLEALSEADKTQWRDTGTIGIQQTVTYSGTQEDEYGRPQPLYHFLAIARPGPEPGSGVAAIISLLDPRAPKPLHTIVAETGGPEAALARAEKYLDSQHPRLKKMISKKSN